MSQGSGLGVRLTNVGCLIHTHHLPQLLLCRFIFSSPHSLPTPSIPLSPGGWTSSPNSLALISAARVLEGEKSHKRTHPSHASLSPTCCSPQTS